LEETYGIIVYQEQVMRVASDLAGFPLSKADNLRHAMGKKKKSDMQKLKIEFLEGCQKNDIKRKTAEAVFNLIIKFASYGFNKSHSAAYALLAFQTAYLKRHYPSEFMAATLSSEINDSSRIAVLIEECRRMGIEILPPDINISSNAFEVTEKGGISFALSAIKNVGKSAIRSLIKAREEAGNFSNIYHMLQNVDLRAVNKKILEALVQSGALDNLEGNRSQNFAAIESGISFAQKYQSQANNKTQISLFEMMSAEDPENDQLKVPYPSLPEVPEWPLQETLQREKELLGFYISGHPLDKYQKEQQYFSNLNWKELENYQDKKEIQTGAILTQIKTHLDRKGNIMAFITLEDKFNSFEGVVFASIYEKYSSYLNKGEIIFVKGKVSETSENSFRLLCDEIIPISEVWHRFSNGLYLVINPKLIKETVINKLQKLIQKHPGDMPLYFEMKTNGNSNGLIMRSKKFQVILTDEFLRELQKIIGEGNIQIK
jgi:DNA polymerase-3 subunit alpha